MKAKPPELVALEQLGIELLMTQPLVALTEPEWRGGPEAARLRDPARMAALLEFVHERWTPPTMEEDVTKLVEFMRSPKPPFPLAEMREFTTWLRETREEAKGSGSADVTLRDPMYLVVERTGDRVDPAVDANRGIYLLANPIRFQALKGGTKRFRDTELLRISGVDNMLHLLRRCRSSGIKLVSTSAVFDSNGPTMHGADIDHVIAALETAG